MRRLFRNTFRRSHLAMALLLGCTALADANPEAVPTPTPVPTPVEPQTANPAPEDGTITTEAAPVLPSDEQAALSERVNKLARLEENNRRALEAMSLREFDRAREILKGAITESPEQPVLHYNMACIEALSGNIESALNYLSASVDLGFNDIEHLNQDRDLDNLRSESQFKRLYQIVASNAIAASPGGGPEVADIYKMEPGEGVEAQPNAPKTEAMP